jgi:molecular chaperone IbpA|tara:strand:+ start:118 stop:537 length:420 start_codon:yes stop_codon:yes gene_type:complete
MTRLSIWNDLRPFSVGFDDLFDHFNNQLEIKQTSSYPPYNINRIDDLNYQIEMALAGFSKNDIEIKYSDNQLTIKSIESEDKEEKETLHRGISKRKFSRTFTLAEDIKVNGAELKDGMLLIELEKIVPEEKKPRTIDIK